uniref:Uncharacterized protein n=1 Tax=Schistocephalus solidus TaxID=70667 RepID=A0A0X3NIU7_SCHSO
MNNTSSPSNAYWRDFSQVNRSNGGKSAYLDFFKTTFNIPQAKPTKTRPTMIISNVFASTLHIISRDPAAMGTFRMKRESFLPILFDMGLPISAPKTPPIGKPATMRLLIAETNSLLGNLFRLKVTLRIKSSISLIGAFITPV